MILRKIEKKYSHTTERNFVKIFFKRVREHSIFSRTVLQKSLKKFLSVVREYFFSIFLKIMNNELGNYAKSLILYCKYIAINTF